MTTEAKSVFFFFFVYVSLNLCISNNTLTGGSQVDKCMGLKQTLCPKPNVHLYNVVELGEINSCQNALPTF